MADSIEIYPPKAHIRQGAHRALRPETLRRAAGASSEGDAS